MRLARLQDIFGLDGADQKAEPATELSRRFIT